MNTDKTTDTDKTLCVAIEMNDLEPWKKARLGLWKLAATDYRAIFTPHWVCTQEPFSLQAVRCKLNYKSAVWN